MSPIFAQLVREYPNDVSLVWKDFPLPTVHLFSQTAANAARCAQDQDKFWEYHDALFTAQDTFALNPWADIASDLSMDTGTFNSCLDARTHDALVVQGYFVARTFSLEQAPSYFINGTLVSGKKTYEELKAIVDAEIAK
jgi:protein-disulfide isomerase